MKDALQHALDVLSGFLAENPLVGAWYTTVVRFVFPLLALMILVGAIRSLWKVKHPDEVWGYLTLGNGVRLPLTHWENIIGRAAACDVQLEYPSVSRQHAALIRENDGSWTVYDLNSKGGIKVNDLPVDEYAIVEDGDTVSFGGIPTTMVPISAEEKRWQMAERREEGRPAGMWGSLVLLTLFQVLTAVQLVVAGGGEANVTIPLTFFVFTCVCWGYFIFMRMFRRIGFEMETIAFFLCTLSLAVTGSTVPDELPKQLIAIFMGMTMFLILGFFLRDLTRAQKVRWFMGATAVGLLALTLLIVVLAVGAVVLNLFNIRERKYEVGVLTAIGVKKVKVAAQFAIELLIVTMCGIALGVAGGAVASVPVSNQLRLLAGDPDRQPGGAVRSRRRHGRRSRQQL